MIWKAILGLLRRKPRIGASESREPDDLAQESDASHATLSIGVENVTLPGGAEASVGRRSAGPGKGLRQDRKRLPSRRLTRTEKVARAKRPQNCEICKSRLQPSRSGVPIQLIIGLDFGTLFSKVVVGEPRVRYAVPFDQHVVGGNPLLLPSSLCVVQETGMCHLGINRSDGSVYDNLKMPLIERDFSEDVQARAAAFLALVFRHVRGWLLSAHGSTYRHRRIEWFVNIGMPTDIYHDEKLISIYTSVVKAAWEVSCLQDDITLQRAHENLGCDSESRLSADRFHVFPEFVAQLASYVRSSRRRRGLHIVIDVGGGTLDITVFNVYPEHDEHVHAIFARKVERLGVRYLVSNRIGNLQENTNETYSPFDNLPNDVDFMRKFGISQWRLKAADQPFARSVLIAVRKVLHRTRMKRYPKAPQWDLASHRHGEPLPAFLCGGGASAQFYADLLRKFETCEPPYRFRASGLPVPEDIETPRGAVLDFARLAVAHGLSFEPLDLARIIREDEIRDILLELPTSRIDDRYVGKEQV